MSKKRRKVFVARKFKASFSRKCCVFLLNWKFIHALIKGTWNCDWDCHVECFRRSFCRVVCLMERKMGFSSPFFCFNFEIGFHFFRLFSHVFQRKCQRLLEWLEDCFDENVSWFELEIFDEFQDVDSTESGFGFVGCLQYNWYDNRAWPIGSINDAWIRIERKKESFVEPKSTIKSYLRYCCSSNSRNNQRRHEKHNNFHP